VPYLIDGNNLMHALAKAGASASWAGLCRLLEKLIAGGHRVRVVFDGPARAGSPAQQNAPANPAITYAVGRPADEIIEEFIAADSAPRRLTVVSTDRQIRRAARKRRCTAVTSEEFARALLAAPHPDEKPPSPEPPEKRRGLNPDQTRKWLREFGFDEKDG